MQKLEQQNQHRIYKSNSPHSQKCLKDFHWRIDGYDLFSKISTICYTPPSIFIVHQ